MTSDDSINPAVIKKTQESLGKYIKKPALNEKLLKKPPFRFLHDIVHAVIKETGHFGGLYTKTELNSENIKDRDAKVQFLQKIIDVIKIATEQNVSARPSKIVAGHEPTKTNELLQLIGHIIENKIDCKEAIETVTNGAPQEKTKRKESLEKKVEKPAKAKKDQEEPSNAVETAESKVKVVKKPKEKVEKTRTIPSKAVGEKEKKESDKKVTKQRQQKASDVKKESVKAAPDVKKENNKVPAEIKKESSKVTSEVKKESTKVVADAKKETSKVVPDKKESIKAPSERKPSLNKTNSNEEDTSKEEKPQKKEQLQTNTEVEGSLMGEVIPTETPVESNTSLEKRRKSSVPSALEDSNESSKQSLKSEASPAIERKSSSKSKRPSAGRKSSITAPENVKSIQEEKQQVKSVSKTETATDVVTNAIKPAEAESSPSSDRSTISEVRRQSTFVREDSTDYSGRPRTSLRPPSVRPASARPGAPRRRDKNVEIVLQPNDSVKMAGISVKVESFSAELEDDGENLVVIENSTIEDVNIDKSKDLENIDGSQQGHLVQQILETQKELTQTNESDAVVETEWDIVQKRQSSAKQMDSLRDVIQSLTRSVNPLGKLMDFIPEDIDSMQLELTMWRDAYSQAASDLKKERNLTESAIEPMKVQLLQINTTIKEHIDLIDASRAKILINSEKIHKLLTEQ